LPAFLRKFCSPPIKYASFSVKILAGDLNANALKKSRMKAKHVEKKIQLFKARKTRKNKKS